MKFKMSIEIKNLTKSFGEKRVIDGLSFSMPEHGFVAVTGKSGRGKTTLLRILAGLEKPSGGEIIFTPANPKFSMVFQEDRLLEKESALENAAIAGNAARARDILSALGLSDVMDKKVSLLSGGMARRVAIARALAAEADIYIFDEPIKGLDKETARLALDVIKKETAGKLVLYVSHSEEEISDADVVIDLEK